MNYKFKNKEDWFYVFSEQSRYSIIERFTYYDWTPQKIQSIITGIEESKTKEKGEEFFWGSEDVSLYSNKNGVLLIDEMAIRGGEDNPEKVSLQLTHEEMLTFLNDFKKFVEENS